MRVTAGSTEDARRGHYSGFHDGSTTSDGSLVVVGNCQAESLRLLLDPDGSHSVRIPPVFELTASEVPRLHELVSRADALVVQPVRDGYRGHALGTAQLARSLPRSGRVVVVPSVRHNALHPAHVVQHPRAGTTPLPLTPYHDLRVVRAALTGAHPAPPLQEEAVRRVARASLAELARREADTCVAVSDVLARPHPEQMRTVNHPGNPVLLALAARVAAVLDREPPVDPGRPLLASVRAPVEPEVAATWGLDPEPEHGCWWLDGTPVPAAEVAEAHLRWYAAHPAETAEVWSQHRDTAERLGLAP